MEEGDVSRGALGLGFEGWSHKYCCTSSMPGDCASISMADSKLKLMKICKTVLVFFFTV